MTPTVTAEWGAVCQNSATCSYSPATSKPWFSVTARHRGVSALQHTKHTAGLQQMGSLKACSLFTHFRLKLGSGGSSSGGTGGGGGATGAAEASC